MSDPRADIPRERFFYPGGSLDPVRANAPFTPATGNSGAVPNVPVLGILAIAAVVLVFEHFRKGR